MTTTTDEEGGGGDTEDLDWWLLQSDEMEEQEGPISPSVLTGQLHDLRVDGPGDGPTPAQAPPMVSKIFNTKQDFKKHDNILLSCFLKSFVNNFCVKINIMSNMWTKVKK